MRSPITSRANCANESKILRVNRLTDVVVLNDWVTLTKVTSLRSKTSTSLAKSINARDNGRSCRRTTTSTRFASMSAINRCSAGRSRLLPENPPSS
jgi:hypothetical protein